MNNIDELAMLLGFSEKNKDIAFMYALVYEVNADGSLLVQIDGTSTAIQCANMCGGQEDDRVLVIRMANGSLCAIANKTQRGGGGGTTLPVGTIQMFGAATAPTGWLLCQGQSLLRTSYSSLFSVIGTTYGSVDSTHFNLPNMCGRTAIGSGSYTESGTSTTYTLGGKGGEKNHVLLWDEMPKHYHGFNNGASGAVSFKWNSYGWGDMGQQAGTGRHYPYTNNGSDWNVFATDYAGTDLAHNNMMPYETINYIIYAGN